MKTNRIKILTIIGLISTISLQMIWLYSTYSFFETDVNDKANRLLDTAMSKEVFSRADILPDGTAVEKVHVNENGSIAPDYVFFQEKLLKYGSDISLIKLDSIYSLLLSDANINTSFTIDRIQSLNKSLLNGEILAGAIKTKVKPLRLDYSEGVQVTLTNPYWTIFERMGLLLIATALMVFFVIGCIIYQIRIIAKQYQVAEMRECFSSSMVHDMKSPLSSIHMGIRILESGKIDHKPEVKAQHFQIIKKEIQDLLGLTNKVLTISKMESGKLELDKQKVFLPDMISELADKFTLGSAKPIQFTTILKVETVFADEEYLKEAISNLIDNAIKYSKKTGQIEIEISSAEGIEESIITVRDNGIGISAKDQKLIFEKFERASATGRTSKKGSVEGFGLGLNYVWRMIEAHGGSVKVKSIEGKFSEFSIHLTHLTEKL